MKDLTDDEIDAYVATNEWQGCVGCYRVEGEGKHLFSKVGGDHTAVIGLPIAELKESLSLATRS